MLSAPLPAAVLVLCCCLPLLVPKLKLVLFVPLFALCLLPGCLVPLAAPEPVLVLLVHLPGALLELGLLALLFVHLLALGLLARLPVPVLVFVLSALLLVAVLVPCCFCYTFYLSQLICTVHAAPIYCPGGGLSSPCCPTSPPFNPYHYHQGRGQRRTRRSTPCLPSSATSLAMRHLLHCTSWPPPGPRPAILGLPPTLPTP